MNYPYHLQWTQGYGRQPFMPQCQVLFVYGSRKPFMFHPSEWLAAVQATPRGQVLAFETCHWVTQESSVAFNDAALRWLAGLP